jgi:hypothetical protein
VFSPLTPIDSKVDEFGSSSFFERNCLPHVMPSIPNGGYYPHSYYSHSRDPSIPPSHMPAIPYDPSFSSPSGSNGLSDPGSYQSGYYQQHSSSAVQTFLEGLLIQQDRTSRSFGSNELYNPNQSYQSGYGYQDSQASTSQPFFPEHVADHIPSIVPTFDPNGSQEGYGSRSGDPYFPQTHGYGLPFPLDPTGSTFSPFNEEDGSTVSTIRTKRPRPPSIRQEANNEKRSEIIKELELKISQAMHEEDILSKQAENAREVGKRKPEIHTMYISFLRKSRERLRLQIELLHAQDQQQKDLLSSVGNEKERLEIQNSELNAKVIALEDKLTQTQAELEAVVEQNTSLADQIDTISQKANEHLTENETLLEQISQLRKMNEQFKEEMSGKISEIEKLTTELEKSKQSVEALTRVAELAKQLRPLISNLEK